MNIVIIEDELLASQRLQLLIKKYDPTIKIAACLESIEDAVYWLKTNPLPNLLLMDIQLSDGYSFEIFKEVNLPIPVIFTTAYDNYAIEAFKQLSIDYILKPVTLEALAHAIQKYKTLAGKIDTQNNLLIAETFKQSLPIKYKERFLAKIGQRSFFIETKMISYFTADNKIVYLIDDEGNKFIINYTLEKLETILDPHYFFRISRQVIVHSKKIELIKPYYNNRLKILLINQKPEEEIIVSRERVIAFKKWAET